MYGNRFFAGSVSGVLVSLAEEHDETDLAGNDSDKCQSLFTSVKPSTAKHSNYKQEFVQDWLRKGNIEKRGKPEGTKADNETEGIVTTTGDDDTGSETQSDDSESLLFPKRNVLDQPRSQIRQTLPIVGTDIVEGKGIVNRKLDNVGNSEGEVKGGGNGPTEDVESDSGDSESLLSLPVKTTNTQSNRAASVHYTQHTGTRSNFTQLKTKVFDIREKCSGISNRVLLGKCSNSNSGCDSKTDQSKSCSSKVDTVEQSVVNNSHTTPANSRSSFAHRSLDINHGFSSPITPVFSNRNHSPDVAGAVKSYPTSSPLLDNSAVNLHFHISTGLSPLEPGYAGSPFVQISCKDCRKTNSPVHFLEGRARLGITKHVESGQDASLFREDKQTSENLYSNESLQSQWSEIDVSEYIKLADQSSATVQSVESMKKVTALKGTSSLSTSKVERNLSMTDTSQWSEADEDQFLTLDLDDIKLLAQLHKPDRSGFINAVHTPNTSASTSGGSLSGVETLSLSDVAHNEHSSRSSPRKRPFPENTPSTSSVSPVRCSLTKLS